MCVIITNSDIKQAALAALEEFFDEPCEQCHDVEELEAIMVAMVKTLNERLTLAEKKIKELEARPIATINQHYSYPAPDTSAPWTQPFTPIFTCKI